jgi:hypothetical protein
MRHFTKEDIEVKEQVKRCLTLLGLEICKLRSQWVITTHLF